MSMTTVEDLVAEGRRIGAAAAQVPLPLRVRGGVGVALCCPSARSGPLRREYGDLDLVGRRRDARCITEFLESHGYRGDREFNALQASGRMLFWDLERERQLDVFLDVLDMCHRVDLSRRLEGQGPALAPADLLVCKLQVFETNEKDLVDIAALLCDHELTAGSDDGIDAHYVAALAAADWGLWRTATLVLERVGAYLRERPALAQAHANAEALSLRIEQMPKTRGWRLRARIGERKRWYQLPEDKE
jgi:hypothetical protein